VKKTFEQMVAVAAMTIAAAAGAGGLSGAQARGAVRITEFMVSGSEFVELTNVGPAAVDMTNWSYDDSTRVPGTVFFGTRIGAVGGNESIILTFESEAGLRAKWTLPSGVRVFDMFKSSGTELNLGGDEINIFDSSSALADRLTFPGGGTFTGTSGMSGNIPLSALGTNQNSQTVASALGDAFGSYGSTPAGFPGNPGIYTPVPEPTTLAVATTVVGCVSLLRPVRSRVRPARQGH
jgi:hypothetical protein